MLDCGMPMREIKAGIGFDISSIDGVLVTHCHQDHSKAMGDLRKMGIRVMAPWEDGTLSGTFGGFAVRAFDLPHNGVPCYGFLIRAEGQTVIYMTDFEYCKYTFAKQEPNHILIEANYMDGEIDDSLPNYEHKVLGHASLGTCKGFIETNKTKGLRTVVLLHMGEGAEPERMREEVADVAGCPVHIAHRGLDIELTGDCPF